MKARVGMVAAVLALFGLAWWSLRSPPSRAPAASRSGLDAAPETRRADAIQTREVDGPTVRPAGQAVAGGQPTVRGRVVDELGEPLTGGSVSVTCLGDDGSVRPVSGGTATLGADGNFTALGCEGRVCVDLHHAAAFRSEPWVLEPGRVETLRAQSFGRLEGSVVDPAGDPVSAARVVAVPGVEGEPRAVSPYTGDATTTDDLGTFSLARVERSPCDPCTEALDRCNEDAEPTVWSRVRVTARAPGFRVTDVEIDPDEEGPITIRLEPPLEPIEGTVAGVATVGLAVLARSDERPYEAHRVPVTEGGAFRVEGVGSGTYTLRAIRGREELGRVAGARAGDRVELATTGP